MVTLLSPAPSKLRALREAWLKVLTGLLPVQQTRT